MNLPRVYMCSQSWTPLPPPIPSLHTIPLGHPSGPAPSFLYPASNLDWWFISYMILYMFQCHSPKSSPAPSPTKSKRLLYTSVSLLLSCWQGYRFKMSICTMLQKSHCSVWEWSHSVVSDSCDPMDCSPPGSSVHGIFQARILEWLAISSSRRSSWPRDWTQVSHVAGRCFTIWATRQVFRLL